MSTAAQIPSKFQVETCIISFMQTVVSIDVQCRWHGATSSHILMNNKLYSCSFLTVHFQSLDISQARVQHAVLVLTNTVLQ